MDTADDFGRLADAWCTRWTARAARWKAAARRMREERNYMEAVADEYRKWAETLEKAKGATGWWLWELDGKRYMEPMARAGKWSHEGVMPTPTYSPAEALAWLRDGALPQREG